MDALNGHAGAPAERAAGALVAFVGLSYALSWAWVIPLAASHQVVQPGRGRPTHLPALVGPAVAALLVVAATAGRRGVRDLLRRTVEVPFGTPFTGELADATRMRRRVETDQFDSRSDAGRTVSGIGGTCEVTEPGRIAALAERTPVASHRAGGWQRCRWCT